MKCNIFYFVPSYKCVLHHSRHLSILDSNLISTRDWVISNYRNFVFLLGEGGSFAKIWVRLVSLGEGWDFQIFWVSLMLLGEVHFPWVRVIPLCPLWTHVVEDEIITMETKARFEKEINAHAEMWPRILNAGTKTIIYTHLTAV